MKSVCLIYKTIRKQRKVTEHEYQSTDQGKDYFLKIHSVYFVLICPVLADPVKNSVELQ